MSDSYPKQAKLFAKWAKAMLDGATVGNPSYHSTRSPKGMSFRQKRRRRKRRRRAKALKGD